MSETFYIKLFHSQRLSLIQWEELEFQEFGHIDLYGRTKSLTLEFEYRNHNKSVKPRINPASREIVIHPFRELGLTRELDIIAAGSD